MKLNYCLPFLVLLLAAPLSSIAAGSILRVACEEDDIGAKVSINGKFKGECPVDVRVAEGRNKLLVQKHTGKNARTFEKNVWIDAGVVITVDARLIGIGDPVPPCRTRSRQFACTPPGPKLLNQY